VIRGGARCARPTLPFIGLPQQNRAHHQRRLQARRLRRGAAALDYVLVLGVVLPAAAFMMWAGPRIMQLTYEMVSTLISWPFL
jgi:hypothetical protein